MRYTQIELVQDILYSMDGDEVTNITDNYESTQVAHLLRTVYFDILNRSGLPEDTMIFQLTETDSTTPLVMTLPEGIKDVYWIKYDYTNTQDSDKQYTTIQPMGLEDFLSMSHLQDQSNSAIDLMTITGSFGNIDVLYRNDKPPAFYTTYDDRTILFDSIDLTVDTSNLQTTKTQCYGSQSPTYTFSNSFDFPMIDEDQFPLLLAEAKSLAWAEMKQAVNTKAEQSAKRNWVVQSKNKNAIKVLSPLDTLPNYGRK